MRNWLPQAGICQHRRAIRPVNAVLPKQLPKHISPRNRDNVRKHVGTIREALKEIDSQFDGIENIPMRGFRWVGSPAVKPRG